MYIYLYTLLYQYFLVIFNFINKNKKIIDYQYVNRL